MAESQGAFPTEGKKKRIVSAPLKLSAPLTFLGKSLINCPVIIVVILVVILRQHAFSAAGSTAGELMHVSAVIFLVIFLVIFIVILKSA